MMANFDTGSILVWYDKNKCSDYLVTPKKAQTERKEGILDVMPWSLGKRDVVRTEGVKSYCYGRTDPIQINF